MYRIATHLVEQFWRDPRKLADAIGVLLLTWNQAHYRYGHPDFDRFERFLRKEAAVLQGLRNRDISTLVPADKRLVVSLFNAGLKALEVRRPDTRSRRSPVGVAKALHLLAPRFFPLWDGAIAKAYGCYFGTKPGQRYVAFMAISKAMVMSLWPTIEPLLEDKTPLKVLDEYNYSRFTKGWI